jgi:hypothetical protein
VPVKLQCAELRILNVTKGEFHCVLCGLIFDPGDSYVQVMLGESGFGIDACIPCCSKVQAKAGI